MPQNRFSRPMPAPSAANSFPTALQIEPHLRKTFVLDTNILLHTPQSIFVFEDNDVVIPLAVIEEIDNQKRRQDEIGRNAREVSRILDQLRSQGHLAEGIPLPDGGSVRVEVNHSHWEDLPRHLDVLDPAKPDNRILAVALNLAGDEANGPVILVSKDLNLRVKADVLGVRAEDLNNDKVDFSALYSGQYEIAVSQKQLDAFYRDKILPLPEGTELCQNQFVVMKSAENSSVSGLARRLDSHLLPLTVQSLSDCFGLRPRNKEQLFALELLLDESVRVVTMAGGAGTGKTLLALAAAMELVLENNTYSKLLVTRPVIPLDGQDIGYLPGDKDEKIRPWMQPIFDNLEYLFRSSHPPFLPLGKGQKKGNESQMFNVEEYLSYTGRIDLEALSYIRGRSIARQFIIVDEAQNCTAHTIKSLLTRVGEGSKIVFTGDIQQIDHPYLDSASNGLTILIEKLKRERLTGHVTLLKGERSQVAEMGATLL